MTIHIIDLRNDYSINYTFKVENLVDYKGLDFNASKSLVDNSEPFFKSPSRTSLLDIHPNTIERVNKIL